MRVVIVSKALVSGVYQRKLEEIAAAGDIELTALVPPSWREPRVGELRLERRFTHGYTLETLPIVFNGRHHVHFYRGLNAALRRLQPDVLHIDEESFNLATFQAMLIGRRLGARSVFYNWANIDRRYPPPFSFFERYTLTHAAHAIAGNQEAAAIIRRHGYRGPITVIPQFGVDPQLFTPRSSARSDGTRVVGFIGRLVPEKGAADLIAALAGWPADVRLRIVGDGIERAALEQRAVALGVRGRVDFQPAVSSAQIVDEYRQMDVLVLPSHTTRNWKEQFGRVMIEAMACDVAVVGSSSGEIPHVIGEAGIVYPEGDVSALRSAVQRVLDDAELRRTLIAAGRARMQAHYTQAAIAQAHVAVYRQAYAVR
jgi:glycosyltransferase involved in cell wall biosynthesis